MSSYRARVALFGVGIAFASSPAPSPSRDPLGGDWIATLYMENFSDFHVYVELKQTGTDRYEAFSRPGALRQMVSWRQYALGAVTRKLPPRMAALRIENLSLQPSGDSVIVRGRIASQMFGTPFLFGRLRGDTIVADLRYDTTATGASVGSLRMQRTADRRPLRDYAALVGPMRDTMRAYLFDPRLMDTRPWRGFFSDLATRFAAARDDADAMVAFYSLLPRLGTSHINFTHHPGLAAMSVDSALMAVSGPPESLVTLSYPAPGLALLTVRRWEGVTRVLDTAFARLERSKAHTLVLDIRSNPGGDQTSITMAGHLFSDSIYAGVLLGNRWYRDHPQPPSPDEMRRLPMTDKDDLLTIFHMLRDQGAVQGFAPPRLPMFRGRVYVLTSGRTGSASEPLAYLLQQTGRATLVGERTGAAILAAVPHPVGDGWVLTLPEGDYYAGDGVRIEGRGVHPHVKIAARDALLPIADSLRRREPYGAALLAAHNYASWYSNDDRVERGKRSERWAREAMRLAPDSLYPVYALGTAFLVQGRWDAAFATMDSLIARGVHPQAVRYQIGRIALTSGQQLARGEDAMRAYVASAPPPRAPSRGSAYWWLGMILEKKGDPAGALRAYRDGLAIDPNNASLLSAERRLAKPGA